MRVLTVARWYPSHDSPGRGSFVADLVRATAAAGIEARVVSFDRVLVRGRPDQREAVRAAARAAYDRVVSPADLFVIGAPEDAPVARLPLVRRPGTGDAAALIDDHLAAFRPVVMQLVRDWRPDVIHAHTGLPDGVVAAAVGRELGIPVVVSEHMSTIEAELTDPVALDRYRELLGPGVQLVAVSPALAGRVSMLLGVPATAIGVLPNPVDEAAFPPADPSERDPNALLWVGSIGEHKGIDVLLETFARLLARRPELHLRLVGGERASGDREHLRALAEDLGVAARVSFDGWLPRDQVATALKRARVFVHPSPSETFGVAAAEAILSGLPVAARRSGGVPWIIELSGGFGRVATTDDPGTFAQAIESALDGRFDVTPEEARSRLLESISAPAVARAATSLYESGIEAVQARSTTGREVPLEDAAGQPADQARTPVLPRVLVATGREQAFGLVGTLPEALQRGLVLILPPPTTDPGDTQPNPGGLTVRMIEAEPFRPGTPRPRGRSPLARIRRAFWRPAPTADELLQRAIVREARSVRSGGSPVDVVAVDAPAAVLIASLDAGWIRLAPGSLRWLADRWAAERDRMPP